MDPDPVIGMHAGTCPWLLPALAAQGMDADGADNIAGNGDDWTITFASLTADSLKVERYAAYVDTRPGYTCGSFTLASDTAHHMGGAAICLTYSGATPAAARWIQVVRTNFAYPGATSDSTSFPGYHVFLDNIGNPAGDPFYDPIGTANGTAFSDRPRQPLPPPGGFKDFEFQVFVSTGDLAARTLTIYDGAWWGFELATPLPEPSALLTLGIGLAAIGVARLYQGRRNRLR